MLDSSDRAAYLDSLELIRELDFDVLVPWAATAGDPYHAVTSTATRAAASTRSSPACAPARATDGRHRPDTGHTPGFLTAIARVAHEKEGVPLYLTRFSYTPETWARLISNPEDRRQAAQTYIESVGGKLHGFWYAFGTHEGYNLWEAPDNVSMSAVALAINSGGALGSIETTELMTVDETLDALRKAGEVQYRAPGS